MKDLLMTRRSVLRLLLACVLLIGTVAAALLSGASVAASGHTGQALSLRAALHPSTRVKSLDLLFSHASRWQRTATGRYVLPRALYQRHPMAGASGATSSVSVNEPVQTYDTFAPPPAFAANVTLGGANAGLIANNQTPVWSTDGTYLVFSANLTSDGHYHLFAISSSGDQPGASTLTQITSGGGNEFYPSLNSNNTALAFTSDARTPGTQNLYVVSFAQGQLPSLVNIGTDASVTSLTFGTGQTTGFSNVARPTWSPSGQQIAFSAVTTASKFAGSIGKHHIYFLYVQTGGYLSSGGTNNPPGKLSDGPTDDTDPAWSPDGQYIAFASTASGFANTGQGIQPNPTSPASETTGAVSTAGSGGHSLFALTPGGNVPGSLSGGHLTTTSTDDISPAFRLEGDRVTSELAFARQVSGHYKIQYFTASTYTPPAGGGAGTEQFLPNGGGLTQLNTSDAANAFNDIYPTWSPILQASPVNSIAYASNRSITYNDPTTGVPSETAISLAPGSTNPKSNNVGAAYTGILQSQIDNLDPPTLLPYSGNEVVHVTDTAGNVRRNGDLQAGQPVNFTVRLSNREAGVDDNNVYIQIKDPDSKYQDYSGREHKVFTYPYRRNDSDTARFLLFNVGTNTYSYNTGRVNDNSGQAGYSFGQTFNNRTYGPFFQYGIQADADGGSALTGYVMVGRLPINDASQNPISVPVNSVQTPLPGALPTDFNNPNIPGGGVSAGQEYECQFLNAQFGINGTSGGNPDTVDTDYGVPYYLAGADDQGAHFGPFSPPRPEWLHLVRLPAARQDANGGVLYSTVNADGTAHPWITPSSPSDYFLDVIAYDKSTGLGTSATTTTVGTPASAANWRIYDNVWGFSTQPFVDANDILVVSDNALGQKFAATTFSNLGSLNLRPMFFGAESYLTDIDVNLLPNALFRYVVPGGTLANYGSAAGAGGTGSPAGPPGLQPFGDYTPIPYGTGTNQVSVASVAVPEALLLNVSLNPNPSPLSRVLNGLGVGSYNEDFFLSQGFDTPVSREQTSIDGRNVPRSQQYSLWRILSRGPVPLNLLTVNYGPTSVPQPAVNDTQASFTADAATVPAANRCVVWISPFTGDLPLNQAGSLSDPATQQNLKSFLNAGGRLFVSGQDVASAITGGGGANNPANTAGTGAFVPDFLDATLASGTGGSQKLSLTDGAGHRISSDAFVNVAPDLEATYNRVNMQFEELTTDTVHPYHYTTPASLGGDLYLANNYNQVAGSEPQWRTDGSPDQLGPVVYSIGVSGVLGQIDTINPANGAHSDSPAGSAGLVYNENTTNGSRVVFGSFGLEGMGTGYYKVTVGGTDHFGPHNIRQNILHNIVCYLRTGTFTGRVLSSTGGGVANATVYLRPNGGAALPGQTATRQCFSGLTDGNGNYTIRGVEPGAYTVYAYKQGFADAAVGVNANPNAQIADVLHFSVEGDTTASNINLTITPLSPGSISGKVVDSSGNPVVGTTVSFASTDGQTTVSGRTGTDGTYTIAGVQPNNYTGTATASGFTPNQAPDAPYNQNGAVVVTSGNTTSGVNFTLRVQPGTLGGLVTDDFTHLPVPGVTVTVKNPSTSATVATFTTSGTATTPTAGATGDGSAINYTGSLVQGTYTVTITPPNANYNNAQPTTNTVTITSNQFARQNFTLTSTLGTIQGIVTDKMTGQPIAGAQVTVTQTNPPAGTNNVHQFTTAADGTYGGASDATAQIAQGSYTATVAASNYLTTPTTPSSFTITAHQPTTVNAQLLSTLGTFGGLVTDSASGQPLTGATVAITDANGAQVAGSPFITTAPTTAPDGTTRINFGPVTLPAVDASGTPIAYTLTVTDQGGGTATTPDYTPSGAIPVTLTPRAFTAKGVALTFAYGTIEGLVSDSLTPSVALAGATLTVTDSNGNVLATITSRNTTTPAAPTDPSQAPVNYNTGPKLYDSSLNGTGTTYQVTVAATNHMTQGPISVVVKGSAVTRQNFPLVSTIGSLGGLVLDAVTGNAVGGATVTVSDGKGNVVATFTSNGTETTSSGDGITGDGKAVNYGGPLQIGAYSVAIKRPGFTAPAAAQSVTITPNTFSRIDFSGTANGLTPVHVFGAGYNFFSVPYDYASAGVGFDQLFGTLNTGTRAAPSPGSNRSHIFVWSPQILQYVLDPQAPADGLHLGQGYWVYLLASHEVTVTGASPAQKSVAVALHQGWNQLGVPSLNTISVSNLTFTNPATGAALSFSDASGSVYRLISGTLYSYNGSGYTALTGTGSMQPWQAYWIYAFNDVTVNVPTS